MAKQNSARAQLREYFLANVGKVLNWTELQKAAGGISEWARRVRELRVEEGFNIVTDKDRSELKPGQYMLVDTKPRPIISRSISKQLRAFILDRNGFTCQMCGAVAGEPSPYDPSRKTRLHIGHIIDKSMGGTEDPNNLRALCSDCNEGAANLTLDRPTSQKLLTQIRRAPNDDQIKVLKWLLSKFPKEAMKLIQE